MPYLFDPGAILGALSGVAMAGLGAGVLRIRPWRASGLAFSAFAVTWGLQVLAANLGQMAADPGTALPWARLFVLLAIPVHAPLLAVVLLHARPAPKEPTVLFALVLAAPAAALAVLYAADPGLFVAGTTRNAAGLVATVPGPLFHPLLLASNVLAFSVALAIVLRRLARGAGGIERAQLALVAATLALYVSYRAAEILRTGLFERAALLAQLGAPAWTLRALVFGFSFGITVAAASHAARRRDLPWRGLLIGAATLPFVAGVVEGRLVASGIWGFSTIGIWRLAMVACLAYGLTRYRLFDIDLKLHALAPAAAQIVASLFGLDLLWSVAWAQFSHQPLWGALASAGLALALAPSIRLWRALARRFAGELGTAAYAKRRKHEVYRAALLQAAADGHVDPREEQFLAALRRDLGITEEEHAGLARAALPLS